MLYTFFNSSTQLGETARWKEFTMVNADIAFTQKLLDDYIQTKEAFEFGKLLKGHDAYVVRAISVLLGLEYVLLGKLSIGECVEMFHFLYKRRIVTRYFFKLGLKSAFYKLKVSRGKIQIWKA